MNMKRCALIIALSIAPALAYAAGKPGEILQWGMGARALGAGKAYTAVGNDASAAYWNPASMIYLDGQELSMLHSILWEQTNLDAVSYVYPSVSRRAFGGTLVRMASDNFEKRDYDNELLGNFAVSDTAIKLSYGQLMTRNMSLGAALNWISRAVDTKASALYGIDIAALYRFDWNARAGITLGNALAFTASDTEDKLPMAIRIGYAHWFFNDRFMVSADIDPSQSQWYTGFETFLKPIYLRFGINYEEMTAGLGFAFRSFRIDYALAQHTLGLSHRASFTWRFGADRVKERQRSADDAFRKANQFCARGQFAKAVPQFEAALAYEERADMLKKYLRLKTVIEKISLKDFPTAKPANERDRSVAENSIRAIEEYLAANLVNCSKKTQQVLSIEPDNQYMRGIEELLRKDGLPQQNTDEVTGDALIGIKLHRSVAYFQDGKYDLAIKECQQVVELDPNNALAYTRLGSAYYAVGMKDKAIEAWRRALEIDPSNRELQEFLQQAGER